MYKDVIFDLNGVYLTSQFLGERFKDQFGISEDRFIPALKEIMAVVRKPAAPPAYSLWQPHLGAWGVKLTESEFFNFWFSGEKIVPELVDYSKDLRTRGVKVFILSNNFRERTQYYRQHFPEIFANVDKAYFSWETGFVKPAPEALTLILTENKLSPSESLYFDDSEANIKVARALKVNAELWQGLESAKKLIEKP